MPQALRQHLLEQLNRLPRAGRYWIAYSGGLDSTVLLHLMAGLHDSWPAPFTALHVDHGLSARAAEWVEHCRAVCSRLGMPLVVERVSVNGQADRGLEAAARQARYAAFERQLGEGEAVLLAHHRDDQAETLLLQLLRGGGVHGLAAMPGQRPLASGYLMRPLLEVPRERLQAYARQQGLGWIEDPSNFDTSLERNYVRHTLLPQLAQRRAGVDKVLARSAGHFAESAALLDELAEQDRRAALLDGERLSVQALRALSPRRCRNLLRYHLRRLGLPVPQHRPLQRILDELLPAPADAAPLVAWPGAEVRRYRDGLYCMRPLARLPQGTAGWEWDADTAPQLPEGFGYLTLLREAGRGVAVARLKGGRCELRRRQGGERLQPAGRAEHHNLKKLYQEAGIPPWERERRPLLYLDGELAQVPGLWTAAQYAAAENEEGILLNWSITAIENGRQNDDN